MWLWCQSSAHSRLSVSVYWMNDSLKSDIWGALHQSGRIHWRFLTKRATHKGGGVFSLFFQGRWRYHKSSASGKPAVARCWPWGKKKPWPRSQADLILETAGNWVVPGVFEEVALKPGPEGVKSQDKSREKRLCQRHRRSPLWAERSNWGTLETTQRTFFFAKCKGKKWGLTSDLQF